MEFRSCEQGKRADREPSAPVWPEVVDVAGLSLSELRRRLGLIKKSEARLAAMKTAALAEYASRGGEGLARRVALDELQASKQQVRPRGRNRIEAALAAQERRLRNDYNTYRPHSALGMLAPAEYADQWAKNNPKKPS